MNAVLHCAAKERKVGAPADEKGKAQRKAAGENLTPDQYQQSVSALFGTVLPAWLQWRNTYVPIWKEGSAQ